MGTVRLVIERAEERRQRRQRESLELWRTSRRGCAKLLPSILHTIIHYINAEQSQTHPQEIQPLRLSTKINLASTRTAGIFGLKGRPFRRQLINHLTVNAHGENPSCRLEMKLTKICVNKAAQRWRLAC